MKILRGTITRFAEIPDPQVRNFCFQPSDESVRLGGTVFDVGIAQHDDVGTIGGPLVSKAILVHNPLNAIRLNFDPITTGILCAHKIIDHAPVEWLFPEN
jgi:hypothetical protein